MSNFLRDLLTTAKNARLSFRGYRVIRTFNWIGWPHKSYALHCGRVSGINLPIRNAPSDDRPNRRNGPGAHLHAWPKYGVCSHPDTIPDRDRLRRDGKRWVGPVVVSSAQIRLLGQAHVIADHDGSPVVDPAVLADPAILTDSKPPGVAHPHMSLDQNTVTNPSTEQPEQPNAAARWQKPARAEWC
jgi:hypothetical protein